MSNNLPIIVFHKGQNSSSLPLCLKQARRYNLASAIYHLGDFNYSIPGITFVPTSTLSDFNKFIPLYKHASHLPKDFELNCIERWFDINEFVKNKSIAQFLHIDSDVLIFCNVSDEAARFKDYDITVNKWDDKRYMAHYLQVNNPVFLDNFCKFILDTYKSKSKILKHCSDNYNPITKKPWVSDMSLLKGFLDTEEYNIYHLDKTIEDGVCFDTRISDTAGFKANNKTKDINFIEGIPYCYLEDGTPIQMKIIHYNGYREKMELDANRF